MTRNPPPLLETRRPHRRVCTTDPNVHRLAVLYRSLPPMRLFRFAASGLIALTLCVAAARAETPPTPRPSTPRGRGGAKGTPARLLPDQADLLVEVRQPRRLVETLTALDRLKQLRQLAPVREFLDSTSYRRFYQFVAYFEKELGAPWPQLLDRLAGRGAVLGVKLGPQPGAGAARHRRRRRAADAAVLPVRSARSSSRNWPGKKRRTSRSRDRMRASTR